VLHRQRDIGTVEHDDEGRFLGFRREYAAGGSEQTLLLTSRRWIAELWRDAEGDQEFEQRLGQLVADQHWTTLRVAGSRYQAERECEQSRWLQGLVGRWQPDAIEGAAAVPQREEAVWTSRDARVPQGSRIVGPAWVGEGWDLSDEDLKAMNDAIAKASDIE